ncbi:MAG: hypothetical protein HKM07_04795 [Chlamydiae bacterium]|nr:hypothetical protein [Chlamydiota bacterium]
MEPFLFQGVFVLVSDLKKEVFSIQEMTIGTAEKVNEGGRSCLHVFTRESFLP